MEHGDINRALRDMMRRGMQMPDGQRLEGLRDMMERLRRQRQQQLQRHNMEHTMDDLKEKLQDILQTEREGMDRRVQETEERVGEPGQDPMKDQLLENLRRQVERNKETLDSLPESLGGAVRELNDYEFMDPEAARKFQELMDELRGQMANNMMQNMRQNLENMTPGDMSAMAPDAAGPERHAGNGRGAQLPGVHGQVRRHVRARPPQNLQELLEHMRRQMAQMDSLLNSHVGRSTAGAHGPDGLADGRRHGEGAIEAGVAHVAVPAARRPGPALSIHGRRPARPAAGHATHGRATGHGTSSRSSCRRSGGAATWTTWTSTRSSGCWARRRGATWSSSRTWRGCWRRRASSAATANAWS